MYATMGRTGQKVSRLNSVPVGQECDLCSPVWKDIEEFKLPRRKQVLRLVNVNGATFQITGDPTVHVVVVNGGEVVTGWSYPARKVAQMNWHITWDAFGNDTLENYDA